MQRAIWPIIQTPESSLVSVSVGVFACVGFGSLKAKNGFLLLSRMIDTDIRNPTEKGCKLYEGAKIR